LTVCSQATAAVANASTGLNVLVAVTDEPVIGGRETDGELARTGVARYLSSEPDGHVSAACCQCATCELTDGYVPCTSSCISTCSNTDGDVGASSGDRGACNCADQNVGAAGGDATPRTVADHSVFNA
jgi:hypothetical protein